MINILLAQNNFFSGQEATSIKGYYNTVAALNPKEAVVTTEVPVGIENTPLSYLFSPWLIYGSVILFFILFLGAIIVMIVNRSLDRKRTLASLVVAFVVATLPVTLRTMLQVTSFQTRAGPSEVPRNLEVKQLSSTSLTVTWETQAEKTGAIRVGPVPLRKTYDRLIVADEGRKTRQHTVKIENLIPKLDYEFEILSGKEWYVLEGKPIKFKLGT